MFICPKGKRGRPRKQATGTQATSRSVLLNEQTQASMGFGLYQSAETGNSYLNGTLVREGSSRRGKLATKRGDRSTAPGRSSGPTQESSVTNATQGSQAL